MTRRSTPQKKVDDAAFPVRVKFEVPELGFGTLAEDMHVWLVREVGRGDYAWHAAGQIGLDVVAIYFRDTVTADRFVARFRLTLADGTTMETYRSPALPFGRK